MCRFESPPVVSGKLRRGILRRWDCEDCCCGCKAYPPSSMPVPPPASEDAGDTCCGCGECEEETTPLMGVVAVLLALVREREDEPWCCSLRD